jgi:hypothetical protein
LLGLAAAALAGTMAACGGSGSNGAANSAANEQDAAVKFAQCMRKHGIDMPDPTVAGGGTRLRFRLGAPGGAGSDQKFQAANDACRKLLPNGGKPNLTPAQQAQFRDAALKFAQCMRAHGVNVPDPQEGRPQLIKPKNAGSAVFKTAMQACQSKLPKGPGGSVQAGGSTAK